MDNNTESSEQDIIRERDELTPPPEERAKYIYDLIKDKNSNLTNWDILCFCVEYLGSQVLIYSWLDQEAVRLITTRIYEAHYYRDEIPETGIR